VSVSNPVPPVPSGPSVITVPQFAATVGPVPEGFGSGVGPFTGEPSLCLPADGLAVGSPVLAAPPPEEPALDIPTTSERVAESVSLPRETVSRSVSPAALVGLEVAASSPVLVPASEERDHATDEVPCEVPVEGAAGGPTLLPNDETPPAPVEPEWMLPPPVLASRFPTDPVPAGDIIDLSDGSLSLPPDA
jgi:hypothetical protein